MAYGDGAFREYNGGIRFEVYHESKIDGKTYRLSVTGRTKKECREKMDAKIAKKEEEIKLNFRHSLENQTVIMQDPILDWLKRAKWGKVKASSYDRYERTIKNHIENTKFGRTQAIMVTSKDVNALIDDVYAELSLSTVKKLYELLDQFFAFFYAEDLNGNPMNKVQPPRPKKNVGEVNLDDSVDDELEDIVLNDDEIRHFKEQCFLPYKNGSKGRPKHSVDLYFIMMTVLRFGEASAVTWGDIDFEKRRMIISKNQSVVMDRAADAPKKTKRIFTTPKNGKSREVMLSKDAIEALEEIKKRSRHTNKNDLVICSDSGKPLNNSNLRKTLNSVMKAAGLATGARAEKFGLHYLRHTGISYYIRHKIPLEMVSKMAGHSSVAITERIYYHIIHSQQEEMLELMDGIE